MDTALPQKFPFILDRNLAKANCTENRVCTSCDIVVFGTLLFTIYLYNQFQGDCLNLHPKNVKKNYILLEVILEEFSYNLQQTKFKTTH